MKINLLFLKGQYIGHLAAILVSQWWPNYFLAICRKLDYLDLYTKFQNSSISGSSDHRAQRFHIIAAAILDLSLILKILPPPSFIAPLKTPITRFLWEKTKNCRFYIMPYINFMGPGPERGSVDPKNFDQFFVPPQAPISIWSFRALAPVVFEIIEPEVWNNKKKKKKKKKK